MSKENGGPAFPCTPEHSERMNGEGGPGMSLRDYFAAAAVTGFTSNQEWMKNARHNRRDIDVDEAVATGAYEIADAMIAARSA